MQISAKPSVEIEIQVTATETKFYPATHTDPSSGGEINSIEVQDFGRIQRDPSVLKFTDPKAWKFTSFLAGVDRKNPEVQRLLANILEVCEDHVLDALAEAAED